MKGGGFWCEWRVELLLETREISYGYSFLRRAAIHLHLQACSAGDASVEFSGYMSCIHLTRNTYRLGIACANR